MPQARLDLPLGYRFTPRRDPHAPLLALLHADGADERSVLPVGRAVWPGAPLLRPRGSVPHVPGWRFLSCEADSEADLDGEAGQLDRLAGMIEGTLHAREATLVEVVPIGIEGGADALVGLLCRAPRHVAAALLYRPCRLWRAPSAAAAPVIAGVEVLVVTDPPGLPSAEAAALLLSESGAVVTLRVESLETPPPPGIALGRAWLRARLRGCDA